MDENELIENLKKNNQQAYKELVSVYSERVYNTLLGIVQNIEDAEDLTQEVFISIFKSISNFKGESKLYTWIYRITVSTALEYLRKKKTKKRFAFITSIFSENKPTQEIKDFEHPGILLENKERAQILFSAIEKLPDKQKTAYILSKIENLSYEEISKILEISISSVESLLFRAKENLKKLLYSYYKDKL